jgi:hypothetical protein
MVRIFFIVIAGHRGDRGFKPPLSEYTWNLSVYRDIYTAGEVLNMQERFSARLTGNQFLLQETRVIASMKREGLTDSEAGARVREQNLFTYKTAKSITKRVNEVIRRLGLLDDDLLSLFARGSADVARLLSLYMIMKSDRLFREFMKEVVHEKLLLQSSSLPIQEVRSFLEHKAEQSEAVARWTKGTKDNLVSAFLTILRQSGFLHGRREHTLSSPVIPLELEDRLKEKGETSFLKIVTGAPL